MEMATLSYVVLLRLMRHGPDGTNLNLSTNPMTVVIKRYLVRHTPTNVEDR